MPAIERFELEPGANDSSEDLRQIEIFPGEIAGVRTCLVSLPSGAIFCEPASTGEDRVYLILSGSGMSTVQGEKNPLKSQMVAHFPVGVPVKITGLWEEGISFLVLHLSLNSDDQLELLGYDERCRLPYFKKLSDGERYAERIKSPKTISRTLLPPLIVPRMAMGTVKSLGPDAVALHCHPMLEQYFLGLEGNDITVITDGVRTSLKANELMHIPLGSNHGVEVAEGSRLHYLWIDFFLNRQGQDWLKEHKPV